MEKKRIGMDVLRGVLIFLAVVGAVGYLVSMFMTYDHESAAEENWRKAEEASGGTMEEAVEKTRKETIAEKNRYADESFAHERGDNRESSVGEGMEIGGAENDGADKDEIREYGKEFIYTDMKTADPDLSDEVFRQAQQMNMGEPPAEATGLNELEGYFALIEVTGIIAVYDGVNQEEIAWENAEESAENRGGEVTLYVPNLIAGLENVSLLFYGREGTGWEIIPAKAVEAKAKMVTAEIPDAGILTVIYRRK